MFQVYHGDIVPVRVKIRKLGEVAYHGDQVRWVSTYQSGAIMAPQPAQRASAVSDAADQAAATGGTAEMYQLGDSYVFDDFVMGV